MFCYTPPVTPHHFPHYRPSYTAHLSAPISHILYKHLHSPHNIQAEDIFILSDDTERIRTFVSTNENAYKMFMQMMGQHFERSPRQKKTELPLMILAEVESIITRRIRRLRQLQKDQYSSKTSSASFISFSKSYMPNNSRGDYLQSRLSQKSISEMPQFQSSQNKIQGSWFTIYQPVNEEDMESQLNAYRRKAEEHFNSWLLLSGVKRLAPIQQKDPQLIQGLKKPEEEEVTHLIVGQSAVVTQSSKQPEKNQLLSVQTISKPEKNRQKNPEVEEQNNNGLISPLAYLVNRDMPLHIKKQVYKQLCKYSWIGVTQKPEVKPRQKKVRQKAEELLKTMGRHQ